MLKHMGTTQELPTPGGPSPLPDTTFGGDGLVEDLPDLQWDRICHLVYEEDSQGREK